MLSQRCTQNRRFIGIDAPIKARRQRCQTDKNLEQCLTEYNNKRWFQPSQSSPISNTLTEDPDAISYADTPSRTRSLKPKTVRWNDQLSIYTLEHSSNSSPQERQPTRDHSSGNQIKRDPPSISTNNRKITATRMTARLTNGQNPLKPKRTRDNITNVRVAMYELGMLQNSVQHCPPPTNAELGPRQCLCSLCTPNLQGSYHSLHNSPIPCAI